MITGLLVLYLAGIAAMLTGYFLRDQEQIPPGRFSATDVGLVTLLWPLILFAPSLLHRLVREPRVK